MVETLYWNEYWTKTKRKKQFWERFSQADEYWKNYRECKKT